VMLLDRRCFTRDAAASSVLCAGAGIATAAEGVTASILGEGVRGFVEEAVGAFRCVGYDADVVGARGRKVEGRRASTSGIKPCAEAQRSQSSPAVWELIVPGFCWGILGIAVGVEDGF
jgi:hypothetical protein